MKRINIFDKNFIPYTDCSTAGKAPRSFEYIRGVREWDGITLYTDQCYNEVLNTKSRINVAWQVESPVHSDKHFYPAIEKLWDKFDYILTYDERLVIKYPDKCKRVNFGGTVVHKCELNSEPRKKFCIVHSGKKDTKNHELRQYIIDNLSKKYNIDVFGKVTGKPFDNIVDVYSKYMYPIVIENINHSTYFSEKLTDALACGCMPIYNGCFYFDRYFRKGGIISWDIHTLDKILRFMESDDPNRAYTNSSNFDNVKFNYELAYRDFWTTEDWLYKTYFKHWLEKE